MRQRLDLLTLDGLALDVAHQKLECGEPRAVVGIHAAVVGDGGGCESVLESCNQSLSREFRVEVFGKIRDGLDTGGVHKDGEGLTGF